MSFDMRATVLQVMSNDVPTMSNDVPTMSNEVPTVARLPQTGSIWPSPASKATALCRLTCSNVTSHAHERPIALALLAYRLGVSLHLCHAQHGALDDGVLRVWP
ncbi:hypothetical protein GCM10028796_25150 [Ramlibacter monticola]